MVKLPHPNSLNQIEYHNRIKDTHGGAIKCIDTYNGFDSKISHLCTLCNQPFDASPRSILRRKISSCNSCNLHVSRSKKVSQKEFETKIQSIHKDELKVIGKYTGRKKPCRFKCLICDNQWDAQANNVLKGSGCPACKRFYKNSFLKPKPSKTVEEYQIALKEIHSTNINLIGNYINMSTKTTHLCNTCTHQWEARPTKIVEGRGCPVCNQSKGERFIYNLLESFDINFKTEYSFPNLKYKNRLRFDFYIPAYNLLIEYDGIQHYEPVAYFGGDINFKVIKQRDRLKDEFAKNNNIKLLRIPYYLSFKEIKNNILLHLVDECHKPIQKQEVVK